VVARYGTDKTAARCDQPLHRFDGGSQTQNRRKSGAATGKTGFPSVIVREFCYLQLRMLCELIALACLVAHGDITAAQPNKLRKAYEADKILAQLATLHQHFYPQPIRWKDRTAGQLEIIQTGNFLTKEELLRPLC